LRKRICNHLQHAVEIRMHVVVPKSQDTKTLLPKPSIATCIAFRSMLSTVNLDNQSRLQTNEVGDVRPDRHLSSERGIIEAVRAQPVPKPAFGIRHIAAERPSV
jgi:hypothetical protein